MSLADELVTTPQREKSATAGRYDYQTMWGLALLFQQHETDNDYAIVFEFHDDIALLDSSTAPTWVRFYQVKSKASGPPWPLSSLLRREKTKAADGEATEKPSHIDKMYDSIDKFKDAVAAVDFVSNQPCSLLTSKGEFKFSECSSDEFKKIVGKVRERYPRAKDEEVGLLGFVHTDLSLPDVVSHTKGKLQTFIATHLGPVKFSPEAVYQAIADDCRRRANFEGGYETFQQVIREKGVTREHVQSWLDAIANDQRAADWGSISPKLQVPFAEERAIRREYELYRATALNSADKGTHRVRLAIRSAMVPVISDPALTLSEMLSTIAEQVWEVGVRYLTPYSETKMKAMILYEIYTAP